MPCPLILLSFPLLYSYFFKVISGYFKIYFIVVFFLGTGFQANVSPLVCYLAIPRLPLSLGEIRRLGTLVLGFFFFFSPHLYSFLLGLFCFVLFVLFYVSFYLFIVLD